MISARGDESPLAACLSAVEAGSSPSESKRGREIFEGLILSTVTHLRTTGEIVVGLDKLAVGWRPAASARSMGQPLHNVQLFSSGIEGVIARTLAAKDGPAEIRGSAAVRLDVARRRRSLRVMDGIPGPRPCEPQPASCGPPADQVLEDGCALDTDSRRPKVMQGKFA